MQAFNINLFKLT